MGLKTIFNKDIISFDQEEKYGWATSFFQGFSISILNPKILVWFIAIYSQFMSEKNDFIFNTYLVITAGAIDALWYILLTILVTSSLSLNFIKSNIKLFKKITGYLLMLIGLVLFINII